MNPDKEPTLDVARRILAELAEMTEHASLTGGLRGGEAAAAQAYNRVLATFVRNGVVPEGMFDSVPPDGADYGNLGIQCRLLMAAASPRKAKDKEGHEGGLGEIVALAPFLDAEDLDRMVMERVGEEGTIPNGLLVGLAPFLGSDVLGQIVRRRTKAPTPPTAPTPPAEPQGPLQDSETDIANIRERSEALPSRADEFESGKEEYRALLAGDAHPAIAAEVPATLESLAAELRRPDLSLEERQRIAMRLAELSYEQATQA